MSRGVQEMRDGFRLMLGINVVVSVFVSNGLLKGGLLIVIVDVSAGLELAVSSALVLNNCMLRGRWAVGIGASRALETDRDRYETRHR